MTSIQQLLIEGRDQLGGDSAALDAELLLSKVLDKNRTWLYTWSDKEVPTEEHEAYRALLLQREQGTPVAYLLGYREFWSLGLLVSPETLIPRPETELLVETALELLPESVQRIVDLGCGTGAIALALASERETWQILASDRIAGAATLAEKNRRRLNLNNVTVIQGDWAEALATQCWDMVISNPPYIDQDDHHLQQGDVRFEPLSALVAERKGLADIEKIACQSRSVLVSGGYLLLEHGYQQKAAVHAILLEQGYADVRSLKDLAGLDRLTLGRKQ